MRRSDDGGGAPNQTNFCGGGDGGEEKRVEAAFAQRSACGGGVALRLGDAGRRRAGLPRDQRRLQRAPTTNSYSAVNIALKIFFLRCKIVL